MKVCYFRQSDFVSTYPALICCFLLTSGLGCSPNSSNRDERQQASINLLESMRFSVDLNGFEKPDVEVGDLVPEIAGPDLEGKKFALSDYRGKIVLLSFMVAT